MQNNWNNMMGYGGYNFMPQPQRNEFAYVDSLECAKAYQCKPNTVTMLMENDNPIFYRKETDMNGRTISFKAFDFVEHKEENKEEKFITREDFEKEIAELKALLHKE